jgi:hypothetical protein
LQAAAAVGSSPPRPPLPPHSPQTLHLLGIGDSPHFAPHTPDSHFSGAWRGSSPVPSSPGSPHITLAHYGSAPLCDTRHLMSPPTLQDFCSNLACSPSSSLHCAPLGLHHGRPPLHPLGRLLPGRSSSTAVSPASAPFPARRSSLLELPPRPPPVLLPTCRFCRVQPPNTMSLVAHVLSKGVLFPQPCRFCCIRLFVVRCL